MPTSEIKRTYEAMFMVDSAQTTSNWDGVLSEINTLFERVKAEVIGVHKWEENRLCYEIKGCKRATYILSYFRVLPDAIKGLERDIQINEIILRVLVLRADHVSPEEMANPKTGFQTAQVDSGVTPAPESGKTGEPAVAVAVAKNEAADALPEDFDSEKIESTKDVSEDESDGREKASDI